MAARYLSQDLQTLAAAGFIAAGLLAIWGAATIGRRHPGPSDGHDMGGPDSVGLEPPGRNA